MTAANDSSFEAARRQIDERSRELRHPRSFPARDRTEPGGVGAKTLAVERRTELRRVAYTKIDELEKHAKLAIDRQSAETQTKLLADGLTSEDARRWLESMPTAEQLMPPVSMAEIRKRLRRGADE